MHSLVFDIETYPLADAEQYLEPLQAARNLVDPVKIAADIEKRTEERLGRLALDWNVARIAAIAFWTPEEGTQIFLGRDDVHEARALEAFWSAAQSHMLVGFNIKGFDLRFCIQRSRFLGVPYPKLDIGKYARARIIDLYLELTFNDGVYDQGAMRRTLPAFCKRFGIAITESAESRDVPALAIAGEWDRVVEKVEADLALTCALAHRLGYIAWSSYADEGGEERHDSLAEVSHGQEEAASRTVRQDR